MGPDRRGPREQRDVEQHVDGDRPIHGLGLERAQLFRTTRQRCVAT